MKSGARKPANVAGGSPKAARVTGDTATIERLRRVCLGFPEANERISHGEPTWFAGRGKVFAMLDDHHHGSPHLSVWLPQPPGAQEALIEADPASFFRPPYVGPRGWLGVVLDRKPDWSAVAGLVRDAYVHVAAKKLVAALEAMASTPTNSARAPRASRRATTTRTAAGKSRSSGRRPSAKATPRHR